jgi:hypothetical protein
MSISLGKGLLIAAGIGAVGVGGFMLLKNKDGDKAGGAADPNAVPGSEPAPGTGAPGLEGPPTGTTIAPASPMPGGTAASPVPTAGTSATPGGQAQGEQVGPYTIVPDPQTGLGMVIETATQQPVGVLDQQGNVHPVTVDANGQVTMAPQEQPTTSALWQGTQLSPSTGTTSSPTGPIPAPQDRSAAYQAIAADLFSNAIDPSIGSAASDPMAGVANLGPSSGMQAGAVTASGAAPSAGSGGQVSSRQVGEFTLLDDGSGVTVVLETATKQPVGMMDAAGNVTPISVDANGNISVSGGAQPATATAPTTPAMAGAATPSMTGAMPQPLG